jgi:flagellar hook-length control protein FliK
MPRAIETLLPPAPIRKAAPVAPKAADAAPASERSEDFKEALKSAGKKAAQNAKPEEKPAAKNDPKKTTGKPQTKAVAKGTKPKPASSDQEDVETVDESTPEEVTQELPAGAEAQVQSEAAETQATAGPDAKEAHDTGTDRDHPAPDAAATELNASQLVQPADRPKDQPQKKEDKPDKPAVEKTAQPVRSAVPDPAATPPSAPVPSAATPALTPTAIKPTPKTSDPKVPTPTAPRPAAPIEIPESAAVTPPQQNEQPIEPTATPTNVKQPAPKPIEVTSLATGLDIPPDPTIQASPKPTASKPTAPAAADATIAAASAVSDLNLPDPSTSDTKHTDASADLPDLTLDAASRIAPDPAPTHLAQSAQFAAPAAAPAPSPEIEFAQANHDKIVSGVQSQLLPHGGAMQIRLDPPELGALKVMVEMRDGVMSATFQTSNEQATQLLSHSLNQLKHVLESQGVTVERLQVQQAPKSEQSSSDERQQQQQQRDANEHHTAQQEQQRKEMLRRMWRKVSGAGDPIDYIA